MSRSQRLFAILVVLGAFVFRLWALDDKPAHFDEGVNGTLVDEMLERGYYEYHPENFHGPLHFYVLFAGQQLFGRSLWVLRMPTVLIGTAVVALLFAFRRWLSFRAVAVAAVAMAVSPAMTFYSRYAIHEMWLPFFILLALYGGLGWAGERRTRDLWALGLGLAGMVVTKETYLFHWIAAAISIGWMSLCAPAWAARPVDGRPDVGALFSPRRLLAPVAGGVEEAPRANPWGVTVVCLGLVVAFYSGFGMNWHGVTGLWTTWAPMFFKGYGTGQLSEEAHHKELFYYLTLLWHYEWPALLGLIAAPILALAPSRWLGDAPIVRFFALLGLGSMAAYSLVPYKTPWCIIAVLPPLFLVLGWLADRMFETLGKGAMETAIGGLLLTALFAQPAVAAWRLNFRHPTDDGGRYAYVQTTRDIEKLLRPLRTLIAQDPMNRYLRGHIFGEGHPLHWELGDLPNVFFFDESQSPETYDADFILLPIDRVAEVEPQLRGVYFKERYRPREFGVPGWLYLAAERFAPLLPGREPEFHPRVILEDPR